MFGEGLAVIPKKGISAIPDQLKTRLNKTQIKFNTSIKEVKDKQLICDDGSALDTHLTIVATDPKNLIANLNDQPTEWKSCYNLYFQGARTCY